MATAKARTKAIFEKHAEFMRSAGGEDVGHREVDDFCPDISKRQEVWQAHREF